MAEQWGPWIEHDGRGCPVKRRLVETVFADGRRMQHIAHGHLEGDSSWVVDSWQWVQCHFAGRSEWRVIRYRVRQLQALTDLKAICENPQPVREDA